MAELGAMTRWREMWHSLRLRILIWALPALAILLLAVLVVDIFAYQWVMTLVAEQRAEETARASAARLARQMQEQAQRLMSVANMHSMRINDISSQAVALVEVAASNPELFADEVSLLNEQGRVIISQPRRPALQGRNLHNRPYFQALIVQGGPFFSDVVEDEDHGRPMIVLSVPMRSPAEQLRSVLVRRFYLDGTTLASMVPHLGAEHPGHIYVLDRTGRVIYHPEQRLINQQLPTDSPIAKAMMQEESGARLLTLPYGEPQVVGYATVPHIGWHLVLQESWEATMAPLRTYLWLGSGALLGGVILSIAAILWGARHISTPVDDLVRQAEAAIQSNYRTRVGSESISELQRLAAAFNRMIEQIEHYRAGLRRYVAAITHSQEEERRRIARELHDDTIQSLVAISRRLELVQASLAACTCGAACPVQSRHRGTGDPQRAQQPYGPEGPSGPLGQLSELQALLQGAIEGTRRFSQELRPTLLEDLGLIPALRRLVKDLTPEGVEADILVRGDPQGVDPDLELALYRIAQEAIHNVRRHAQAHHVEVRLDLDSERIHLAVEDDGRGFEMAASLSELAQGGSFGLMGIQERVELLGGHMAIHSQVGRGTRLEVWLPHSTEGPPPNHV